MPSNKNNRDNNKALADDDEWQVVVVEPGDSKEACLRFVSAKKTETFPAEAASLCGGDSSISSRPADDAKSLPFGDISSRDEIVTKDGDEVVTKEQIAHYRQEFESDSSAKVAQNACAHHDVQTIALRRDLLLNGHDLTTFNVRIDHPGMKATNQKDSGRCWLFATLNLFRIHVVNSPKLQLDVENFEFSESYLHFYDKLEKANTFLEIIMQTANRPLDDRTLSSLLEDPITDGGDWMPAVALVDKYGLVPKYAYPESHTSNNTDNMNSILQNVLLSSAQHIRSMLQPDESSMEQVRKYKDCRLQDVYRILCIHLGTPPQRFDWQWRDDDGVFHQRGVMTPLEFVQETVDVALPAWKSYVCLIQDPRHEYYQTYTVEFSQTLLSKADDFTIFLNVPSEEMKSITQKMLEDGLAVWFACNYDEEFTNHPGLWDADLYDWANLYGIDKSCLKMTKADKLLYGYSMGTHAMLFTGVNNVEGSTRRWRVENSFGTKGGFDGYYCMNDNWYDEYVFEIVASPNYLTDEMIAGFKKKPIVLPAWDAMGSVGRMRHASHH